MNANAKTTLTVRAALAQARRDVEGLDYLPSVLLYGLDGGETLEVRNQSTQSGYERLLGVFEARRYGPRGELVRRYDV